MPTPHEHYLEAERILAEADSGKLDPLIASRMVTRANVHAHLATVPWGVDEQLEALRGDGLTGEEVNALLNALAELLIWAHSPPAIPSASTPDWSEGYVAAAEANRGAISALLDSVSELLDRQEAANP